MISFQPAQVVAPNISSKFGATDEYNRLFPTLAGLYEAAGRNITQASAQTAQNFTQGNIHSAENQTRRTLQGFEIDAQEMQQRRQIEAQQIAQQRQQEFELQRMKIPISHQEQQEQTRRINGLAEIENQVKEGYLTPEQAGDARYELVTGINAFQRRAQVQQAELTKQKTEMQAQEIATMNHNEAMGQQFMLDTGKMGGTLTYFTDKTTGRVHPMAFDTRTGKYYNPFLEHAGVKGEGDQKEKPEIMPGWERYTDKHGEFDTAYAERFSRRAAKYDPKISEELKAEIGKKTGPEAKAVVDRWVEYNVKSILEQFNEAQDAAREKKTQPSAVPGMPAPQAEQAPSAPQPVQQAPPPANNPVMKAIESSNLNPAQAQAASQINAAIQAIMSKPRQDISQRDIAEVVRLREELKKYVK